MRLWEFRNRKTLITSFNCYRCGTFNGAGCDCSDGQTVIHGDCREVLPEIEKGAADLVLTDPPYGIDWKPRVNHRGSEHIWHDNETFDPVPWLSIGRHHCFWGAQYFADKLPPSEAWLVWVKRPLDFDFSNDHRTYATVEMAWSDLEVKPSFKCQTWDGGMRQGASENRTFCHPSQKPIELMRWVMGKADDCETILDPFAGSFTTARAAKDLGRKSICIELEEKYVEIGCKRLEQGVLAFA